MSPDPKRAVCLHERGHITDSRFYGHAYATAESRAIFCDLCRMQRWLDVEAALAMSEAEVGLIPRSAAEAIARTAVLEKLDLDAVQQGIRRTGHSLVPLVRELQAASGAEAGEWVHYGATTQDIQDTAQSLEMGEVLDLVALGLDDLIGALVPLARRHRDDVMVGRTHGQPALPMTFGLKVASWIDELQRQRARQEEIRSRVLVAQLFGGVGTMAGFQGKGADVVVRFAARLGLGVPQMSWHAARDRVSEYVNTLAMTSMSLARIANEVASLARDEVGELEVGWMEGKVGSSTMPHKRNAETCEQVVVLSRLARSQVPLALDAMLQEHERDARGLRLEWAAVADVSHYTLSALQISERIFASLIVHPDRMAEHATHVAESICTEALMFELGRHIGKQTAHSLVYKLSHRARDEKRSLLASLHTNPEVTRYLSGEELDRVFDPSRHTGDSASLVDAVCSAELSRRDCPVVAALATSRKRCG
ncbi:MAG: adenylosuccinate lyase family protein [Bradymonadaceae bacterium]